MSLYKHLQWALWESYPFQSISLHPNIQQGQGLEENLTHLIEKSSKVHSDVGLWNKILRNHKFLTNSTNNRLQSYLSKLSRKKKF